MKHNHILTVVIIIDYNENDNCTDYCAVVEFTNGELKRYTDFKSVPHNVLEWCEKHREKRTIRSLIDGYRVIYEYDFNRGLTE